MSEDKKPKKKKKAGDIFLTIVLIAAIEFYSVFQISMADKGKAVRMVAFTHYLIIA